jgi:hypothetical protein
MVFVHDLCGLLPALETMDEERIIAESSEGLCGERAAIDQGDPSISTIRDFLKSGIYDYLNGKAGANPGNPPSPTDPEVCWSVYVLAASLYWNVDLSYLIGYEVPKKISFGPVGFFSNPMWYDYDKLLWCDRVEGDVYTYWCELPPPFSKIGSDWARLILVSQGSPIRVLPGRARRRGVRWRWGIWVGRSMNVYLLAGYRPHDRSAVEAALTEACLLAEEAGQED